MPKLKTIIFIIIFVAFSLMAGCQGPFVAKYAKNKIKIRMTSQEVEGIVNKLGARYIWCDFGERDKTVLDRECDEMISSLRNREGVESVVMTVGFMGPVFLKNDFKVVFGKNGKVESVSSVRSWD